MSSVQNGNHANGISNGAENPAKKVKYDSQGFLRRLFDIMMRDAVEAGCDVNNKVVEFVHPKELLTKLDLEIRDSGEPDDAILNLCEDTIHYSVHSGHPHFFNQLWSGLDPYTLGGAWLTEALNTSQYTFEVAPVFILMEDVVLKKLREIVGFKDGDGIFTPGGSMANIYGLSIARYHQFPNVKTEGMYGLPRLIIFTSDHSHYSVKKGAHLLGLGVDNLWSVACDKTGRMIPEELEKRIQEAKSKGFHPYFVNATAGTTVAGAFDPLDAIADIAEKHKMWMHVDAAWGGGALMSSKHRDLLRGIERADSLAWDPHKMMGTVLQCAVFLTKHKNLLQESHSANARYLFQQDKFYDVSYDTGDKSLQCGRKVDVFKLWLMWKARGNVGFERRIDTAFENAKYLAQCIRDRDGFRLVFSEPQCTNVVFWYIPPRMRNLPENDEWWQGLGKIAPQIKERMAMKGTMLIGYQPVAGFVNCFRFVTTNGDNVTKKDMDFVLEEIESLGHDL